MIRFWKKALESRLDDRGEPEIGSSRFKIVLRYSAVVLGAYYVPSKYLSLASDDVQRRTSHSHTIRNGWLAQAILA
jgi:hypothetical protein